ncbi:GTP-binding protein [Okeania sp.]|uniref:CobW family GTP-binding protein n=1 Tax=Okeania sp. TaxID=3100323 RepID=UPI002B4B90F5|nr:GTP-binding protein [Okeania sp.]MEB3340926.1 GTP-binding protein [Okeania sp.]
MTKQEITDFLKQRIPVSIITGFLGSGKTTLLNHILKNKQDLRVAVLINEFGDIDIDSQLLVSIEEDMVQLNNGCICCSLNHGLVAAVERVLATDKKIDYLVIETTGIADPFPILLTFLATKLRELTRIDSILTVVDAETFSPNHFDSEAVLKQIAFADIILLNKTDLVSGERLQEVESNIKLIKQEAKILYTEYSQVALPLILDVGLTPVAEYILSQKYQSGHLENDGFMAVSFESDRPMDVFKFENFLEHISGDLFRAKGILWLDDIEHPHIFQMSGNRHTLEADETCLKPNKNQLVFIGRHLDNQQIQDGLNKCL